MFKKLLLPGFNNYYNRFTPLVFQCSTLQVLCIRKTRAPRVPGCPRYRALSNAAASNASRRQNSLLGSSARTAVDNRVPPSFSAADACSRQPFSRTLHLTPLPRGHSGLLGTRSAPADSRRRKRPPSCAATLRLARSRCPRTPHAATPSPLFVCRFQVALTDAAHAVLPVN